MKKTIATKRIKRWQRLDRLVLGVPPAVFLYISIGEGRLLWENILKEPSWNVIAATFAILAFSTAIISLPVVLIWRAIIHSVKNTIVRNATFPTDDGFDYYREKLTGIHPTTISLLMDLQIETEKDLAALLLHYVKIGAISMEDGVVRVLNQECSSLHPSDRTLLSLIDQGRAQAANLGEWNQQVIKEAVESGNLKYRGIQQNIHSISQSCIRGCFSGCLIPILLFLGIGIGSIAIRDSGWTDTMESIIAAAPQTFGAEQINYCLSSPDIVVFTALASLLILSFLAMILLPVASVLRIVMTASQTNMRLKRTEAGELLTAQISGIKNFIRDFSNLSEAEKEQLILWDDFLIYAVVLEENERIIEDIFSMRNLRYGDYTHFKNWEEHRNG